MKKEHLTPDGWKPCTASAKECKYEERRITDASAIIDSAVKDVETGKPNAIKNFFNKLFDPVKKPSSELGSVKEVPMEFEPAPDPVLDEIVQGEGGQYEIACEARFLNDAVLIHKFGDLVKDKATAEMLHQADRHKRCQLGWCGLLAESLFKSNKHVVGYYIFKTKTEPVTGVHHFVKLKDGTYADSLGIWTEEALLARWKDKDSTVELSSFDPNSPDLEKPNVDIKEEDIFPVMNELIHKHINGKAL